MKPLMKSLVLIGTLWVSSGIAATPSAFADLNVDITSDICWVAPEWRN